MTAKKLWLRKIYPDSQDFPKNTQIDICWSSSESDEETLTKKVKTAQNRWFTSDLKPNKKIVLHKTSNGMCQTSANCQRSVDTNVCEFNSSPEVIQMPDPSCNEIYETGTLHQCCHSPITNDVKLEELSPVLVCTQDDFNTNEEASPVLGNKRSVLKRIRFRYKTRRILNQVKESPPELFEKESAQIIESDSPELINQLSEFEPDTLLPTERIDPFPSQHSSQIINSNTESSSSQKNIPLYHQLAPRKRRYKKGGLASLLQKTLHLQRTRVSIWHHEMYTKKTDNIINFKQGKVIHFIVKNKWKEYGNTLLQCSSSDLLSLAHMSELPTENNFIVIIGFNANINFTLSINCRYELFPPYSIKTIKYKSEEVACYFNVSKLVPSKDL